jgi:uncharacterized Zn-binding protein involved in type VI secretion
MVSGTTPHVGGPVTGPGVPGVLINGQPVAVVGDMCVCAGPPDTIVTGCPGVLVNGKPVATTGSLTAHGGQIAMGVPGVTISSRKPMKPATIPLKNINFPTIDLASAIFTPKRAKEAEEKIKEVKTVVESKDETEEPKIYNLRWIKDEAMVRSEYIKEKVRLLASVQGIDDGGEITVKIQRSNSEDDAIEEIKEFKCIVKDGEIEMDWDVDNDHFKKE